MFIEQHLHNNTTAILLTFPRSTKVRVYPCGRRRSNLIDTDGNPDTVNDRYYIPFDPEARLNTEFNNRRYSSTNGFTQSYINNNTNENDLSFTIDGYNFIVDLREYLEPNKSIDTINAFGADVITSLKLKYENENNPQAAATIEKSSKIYANIKLEDTPLYVSTEDTLEYNTWILRNQSVSAITDKNTNASSTLDMLSEPARNNLSKKSNLSEAYYFSGLSFSISPITENASGANLPIRGENFIPATENQPRSQHEFSLCILEKIDGIWKLCEAAKLPRIEHGTSDDSIELGHLNAKSLKYNNNPVALYELTKHGDSFMLKLYTAKQETEEENIE